MYVHMHVHVYNIEYDCGGSSRQGSQLLVGFILGAIHNNNSNNNAIHNNNHNNNNNNNNNNKFPNGRE